MKVVSFAAFSCLVFLCGVAEAETVIGKKTTVTETIEIKQSPDVNATGSVLRPNRPAVLDPDDECDRLYVKRNALFRQLGLCFTRATAVSTFGNAGCRYDRAVDMPISERDRARVNQIVAQERALGCERKP